jgi:hypothetical protein
MLDPNIQFALGLLAYGPLHELLHWLPARLYGWGPTLRIGWFHGIPYKLYVEFNPPAATYSIMMTFRLVLVGVAPLLWVPFGFLLGGVGLFELGLPLIICNLLSLLITDGRETLGNVRETKRR